MKSLASGLADKLSKVADVPVAQDDGLTKFICGELVEQWFASV